jgi:2-methylisocitrate lyase-like PEP mutase family enzyme
MTSFAALHRPGEPLLLPNAWDAATGAALAAEGFPAIGTTSLGVAAAAGKRDATGEAWPETLALAQRLAQSLDCHVTVDMEDGFSDDPEQVAEYAAQLPVAGINLEDAHGDPARHARKIAAVKRRTTLFVNARTDTHWLRDGTLQDAIERAHAYVEAGADGVFVPGLPLNDIEPFVKAVDAPLNVLYTPNEDLAGRGVARISTGSLLFRASIGALQQMAAAIRAGHPIDAPSYEEIAQKRPLG